MDTAEDVPSAAASVPCRDGPDGDTFDVAVVGGGPAGSALAAHLARSGRRTALIERDWYRIDGYRLTADGHCPDCGTAVAGRFEAFELKRQFGPRRIPVAIGRVQ